MRRIELRTHGPRKYPGSELLASSAALGWSTISAELRSHGVSQTPVVVPQQMELVLAVRGNEHGLVRRSGAGQRQQTIPTTGTIWLAPVAVGDDVVSISAPIPETLHLYLPTTLFQQLADDFNIPGLPAHSIRYAAGVRDEVIEHTARSILCEMTNETAAGRMFVETSALMLAARLIHSYSDSGSSRPSAPTAHKLCFAKVRRVLEYISAHLSAEITLAELAQVAGVSKFHFARMFTRAVGVSPCRYLTRARLAAAMAEVAAGKSPLAQIALNARFSSQASFTRAFRRATGMTPGEYRLTRR
jgi:AraC family transcriptional regulator